MNLSLIFNKILTDTEKTINLHKKVINQTFISFRPFELAHTLFFYVPQTKKKIVNCPELVFGKFGNF